MKAWKPSLTSVRPISRAGSAARIGPVGAKLMNQAEFVGKKRQPIEASLIRMAVTRHEDTHFLDLFLG